ncbi:MAG TPA: hypothetical protein VMW15_06845 [Terracidiphilus sp.]|nr:hypothetical protein [Terracidiphilus sp.]
MFLFELPGKFTVLEMHLFWCKIALENALKFAKKRGKVGLLGALEGSAALWICMGAPVLAAVLIVHRGKVIFGNWAKGSLFSFWVLGGQ